MGKKLLLISTLLLVAAVVFVLLTPEGSPPPENPGLGEIPPVEPLPAPPPEQPKTGQSPKALPEVKVAVKLLSTIPGAGPPRPFYAGTYLKPSAAIKVIDLQGRLWAGPVGLRFLAGPGCYKDEVTITTGVTGELFPEGWSLLRVKVPDWPPFNRLLRLRGNNPGNLLLPSGPPCRVDGRVFGPDGKPLAGAQVVVDGKTSQTAEDGKFSFAGLAPGEAVFRISAPRCARALHAVAVGHQGLPKPLTFVLKAGVTVKGKVIFPGRPVAGVEVFLLPGGNAKEFFRYPFGLPGMVKADANGAFTFSGIPKGMPFRFWAQGKGLIAVRSGSTWKALDRKKFSRPLLITLRRETLVRGTVTDEDGKPIVGAKVRSVPAEKVGLPAGLSPGSSLADLRQALLPRAVLFAFWREAVTGEKGLFSLPLAIPGGNRWALECRHPGYGSQRITVSPAGREFKFKLSRQETVATGSPALRLRFSPGKSPTVLLSCRLGSAPFFPPDPWPRADEFLLPLPVAGNYEIRIKWRRRGQWHEEDPQVLPIRGSTPLSLPI